jgi:hypothetical protein
MQFLQPVAPERPLSLFGLGTRRRDRQDNMVAGRKVQRALILIHHESIGEQWHGRRQQRCKIVASRICSRDRRARRSGAQILRIE